ncbi:hypothetical protein GYM62_03945 [Algoriphagus sp. NBT04N3]|uniref:hypothetical protein n=1 Tax=Algoriphagus sp. NBT04N3 TaxID=2705473 RepID=UPI001C6372E6|nr:hypothetical protein [Algoriphagus sp. NBT04N3]QYH37989.1 hypothetical protein GYM62_03945 [Algoriphagus sp. NBT04N3]
MNKSYWSILGALALIIIAFLPWRFQVNDDELMMWLVSGAYTGIPETYAVFIHPILSFSLAKLYSFFPQIPWYPFLWFVLGYFAYYTLLQVIKREFVSKRIRIIFFLFAFAILIHFSFFLQFSIISSLCVCAGLANRISKSKLHEHSGKFWMLSDILIISGFLIRPEVAILLLAASFLYFLILSHQKTLMLATLYPLLFVMFFQGITFLWPKSEPLQKFIEHNQLRSQVFDHPFLQLEKDRFINSEPELYYFSNGLIDFSENQLTRDQLLEWKHMLDDLRWEAVSFSFYKKSFGTFIQNERFVLTLMGLFLLFTLYTNLKKGLKLLLVMILGLVVLAPFYLIKIQIYILLFLLFFILMILDRQEGEFHKWPFLIFQSTLALLIIIHCYSFSQSHKNISSGRVLEEKLRELKNEGYDEIFFSGGNRYYLELVFESSLPFKIMGWSSLFEYYFIGRENLKRVYIVDSEIYESNLGYFRICNYQEEKFNNFIIIKCPK